MVDFRRFRPDLAAAPRPGDPSQGGHPASEPVLEFRMLVLQGLHGLSRELTEYPVRDWPSWMRFCGLAPGGAAPDANTLWSEPG
jgi:hypothetical protein